MFYGLHEKIDEPDENKIEIAEKNSEPHTDVSSLQHMMFIVGIFVFILDYIIIIIINNNLF